jgi:hypothetical protein
MNRANQFQPRIKNCATGMEVVSVAIPDIGPREKRHLNERSQNRMLHFLLHLIFADEVQVFLRS